MFVQAKRAGWLVVLLVSPALGSSPGELAVQGLLRDAGGALVNGQRDLDIGFYDAEVAGNLKDINGDGFADAGDVFNLAAVDVADGLFSVQIGNLHPSACDGTATWMEISVDGSPLSRTPFVGCPNVSEQVNQPGTGVPAVSVDEATGKVAVGAAVDPAGEILQVGGNLKVNSTLFASVVEGNSPLEFKTASTTRMTIADDGRVAIGAAAPVPGGEALQVDGVTKSTEVKTEALVTSLSELPVRVGELRVLSTTFRTDGLATNNIETNAIDTTSSLEFKTNGVTRATLAPTGELAIGAAPVAGAEALQVTGVAKSTEVKTNAVVTSLSELPVRVGELRALSTTFRANGLATNSVETNAIDSTSSVEFKTNGVTRATLAPTGEFAVGAAPVPGGEALQVQGTLRSTEVKTDIIKSDTAIALKTNGQTRMSVSSNEMAFEATDGTKIKMDPFNKVIEVTSGPGRATGEPLEFTVDGAPVMSLYGDVICGGLEAPAVHLGWSGNSTGGFCGATISGGGALRISDSWPFPNTIGDDFATISGGYSNISSGYASTVSGGSSNEASGQRAAISGGSVNVASASFSAIPGGRDNQAGGQYSFASGCAAVVRAGDDGTFIWSDTTSFAASPFESTGSNQFLVNATGGVGIGTNAPQADLHVNGDPLLGLLMITPDESGSEDDSQIFLGEDNDGTFGMTITYDGGVNQLLVGGKSGATTYGPWLKINRNSGSVWAESSGSGTNGAALRANNTSASGIGIFSTTNSTDANLVLTTSGTGDIMRGFSTGGSNMRFRITGTGTVTADGTISGGGADFAEMIRVSSGANTVEPGDLMVIDVNNPRSLVKSSAPRSTLVAGIYATSPGFLGSEHDWDQIERELFPEREAPAIQEPEPAEVIDEMPMPGSQEIGAGQPLPEDIDDGDGDRAQEAPSGAAEPPSLSPMELGMMINEVPVAVVGIVPCKVSAENGAISPGDLLVTSSTPGHAMRDENPKQERS